MKRIGLKLPKPMRLMLYGAFALSWFTGLGFYALETFFQVEGEFGISKHPLQNPALTIHGAAAFAMMMAFGALLSAHVPMGWRTGRVRGMGLTLIGAVALQVVTAWILYYAGNPDIQKAAKWAHLIVGASLPAVLVVHIVQARRRKLAARPVAEPGLGRMDRVRVELAQAGLAPSPRPRPEPAETEKAA